MATATYEDVIARRPGLTAPRETVEAFLEDVAAEISARCEDRGTTYDALVQGRRALVVKVECAAATRMCGPGPVDGVDQDGLSSFSQTVGDHKWEYSYRSSGGNSTLLRDEWKVLGLYGQQIGWLGVPFGNDSDEEAEDA